MRKFTHHVTLTVLKKRCAEKGLAIDTTKHDRDFSDYVTVSGALAGMDFVLIFNTFNGQFFGATEDKREFSETSTLDAEPWYAAILDLLFVGEMEAVHG